MLLNGASTQGVNDDQVARSARRFAETGEEFPPGLLSPTLSHEERAVTASIHPSLMGGEYLPALRDDEVEIVRISLQSTTCDQISLRARRAPNGIAYALVDEYEGDYIDYRFRPRSSRAPLTMGEVVTGLDRACSRGGAVMQPLQSLHKEMGLSEEHRYFVAVESDFYPELGEYYKARIDQFLASNGVGATGST